MTNAHTPGPWKLLLSYDACPHKIVGPVIWRSAGAVYGTITEVHHTGARDSRYGPEQTANARLIAAAPDLLEALRGCLPYIRDMDDDGPAGEGWQSERLSRFIAEADAAIAKATSTEQGERG